MRGSGVEGEVVTSGHSIDVCLAGQSKEDLVRAIRVSFGLGEGPVLRIGDRGRPPGNDWRLLDDPHGLSVDEVSGHPIHCWSLTPAGTKGVQATSHYLAAVAMVRQGRTLDAQPSQSGVKVQDAARFGREAAREKSWTGTTLPRPGSALDWNCSRRTSTTSINSSRRDVGFLESLALWLRQFKKGEERKVAYEFRAETGWCSSRTRR